MLTPLKGAPATRKRRENLAMDGENAQILNPVGISYEDATRSLRLVGYTEANIQTLIEITGDDRRGQPIWRWRTDHQPRWEDDGITRDRVAEVG